jgi:uncharacterized protein (TIGR02453 family)
MAGPLVTQPPFTGFPADTFAWFEGLESDNSRDYFHASRDTYETSVRGALEAMLEQLADELGGRVRMFRQNRDVRFSADKSPFKTTTYGLITDRSDDELSLYAQISAMGLFAGSGYHMLAPDQLTRFRDAVIDDRTGPRLERAVAATEAAGLEVFGSALKTAPRGYDRDHERVALLRHKALFAGVRLPPGSRGIAGKAALEHARTTWAACAPINAWLAAEVGPSDEPPEPLSRGGRRRR